MPTHKIFGYIPPVDKELEQQLEALQEFGTKPMKTTKTEQIFKGIKYTIYSGLPIEDEDEIFSIRPMGSFIEVTYKDENPNTHRIVLYAASPMDLYRVLDYAASRQFDIEESKVD